MEPAKPVISKEMQEKLLDAEKLKNCYECGICTASCPMAELLGNDYNPRTMLQKLFLNPDQVADSDELWLCAWCYRCYKHCNQALKLPEIFLLVRRATAERGNTRPFEKALQKIVRNIPLPLTTMQVCFHPERAGLDKETTLKEAEHARDKHMKTERTKTMAKTSEGKIAVIGSGPAGLTVASELSRKKFKVTIFEALPELGGMLRKCIPQYRLSKQVLDDEIQHIKDLGVKAKTGVIIGKDLTVEDLWKEDYKAIFIGVGAHKGQELRIEGADLKGVIHALDFLWSVNSCEKVAIGKNVAVIGGGNVAVDAARTALKLGADKVTILYRRSREEMPAIPWEVKEAENEGVNIEFLVAPKKILGEHEKVSAVECVRMQLGEPDASGRRKPIPIEGSEFTRETDMIILAIGETPELGFLPKEILLNEDGTIWVDPITMETTVHGVFAGGDVVTGPATVIEAICAGKRAAESIEIYLKSSEAHHHD